MTSNDNSVNIESKRSRYHHGDLREALIDAGMDLLAERSVDELSLREIARRVGVSATAVYRHFPDKQALVFAMCKRGAEALGEAQVNAMEAAGGGTAGFDATGQAYIRFALDNPALFRMMMTTRPSAEYLEMDISVVNHAMQLLRENVAKMLPEGSSEAARQMAAIHAWSLVHGMAMLMLDGQIPADEAIIRSISRKELVG
jgi:AcrR family transcriptional regulator